MYQRILLPLFACALCFVSCHSGTTNNTSVSLSPTRTATIKAVSTSGEIEEEEPIPTETLAAIPTTSATPTTTPLSLQPTFTPSPEPTFTPVAAPTAVAMDDGKVYLGDTLLLDVAVDAPGCFGVGEISYSPTGDYFLVVIACFEGDNDAFLFRADGSDKRQITERWDYFNYFFYEWSPDGRSFVYQRIDSCCITPPPDAPTPGQVRYDISTGSKTLLSPSITQNLYRVINVASDDVLNVRSGPGADNSIVGELSPNSVGIQITGEEVQVGNSLWVPILYQGLIGWVNRHFLTEQSEPSSTIQSTEIIDFYPLGIRDEEAEGNCWASSLALARSDAWRCMVNDGGIFDPCFSIATDNTAVICAASPLKDGFGFKLNLTEPLPAPFPGTQEDRWWILDLADGTICTKIQGTGIQVGDRYYFDTCGYRLLVDLSTSEQVWVAELRPSQELNDPV